jgi:hypothetical protein
MTSLSARIVLAITIASSACDPDEHIPYIPWPQEGWSAVPMEVARSRRSPHQRQWSSDENHAGRVSRRSGDGRAHTTNRRICASEILADSHRTRVDNGSRGGHRAVSSARLRRRNTSRYVAAVQTEHSPTLTADPPSPASSRNRTTSRAADDSTPSNNS